MLRFISDCFINRARSPFCIKEKKTNLRPWASLVVGSAIGIGNAPAFGCSTPWLGVVIETFSLNESRLRHLTNEEQGLVPTGNTNERVFFPFFVYFIVFFEATVLRAVRCYIHPKHIVTKVYRLGGHANKHMRYTRSSEGSWPQFEENFSYHWPVTMTLKKPFVLKKTYLISHLYISKALFIFFFETNFFYLFSCFLEGENRSKQPGSIERMFDRKRSGYNPSKFVQSNNRGTPCKHTKTFFIFFIFFHSWVMLASA